MYGVNTTNLAWFASYLNGRKQYIKITESADTLKKDIKCGVPQGSILGPLLFFLYVNDLPNSSNVLVPIMFADDTNFFFEHSNINTLFETVNHELIKIKEWNKLSLNVGKTKFSLFHKTGKKHSIPSHLPTLKVVSATFLLVCFLDLHESTCQRGENVFYFTSKAHFVLEKIKF